MAEEKKMEEEKSSRTRMLESMPENFMQGLAAKLSRGLDKVGISQEKQYKDKTKEEVSVKKAKGGMIKSSASKRADGCVQRGKTRGKMV